MNSPTMKAQARVLEEALAALGNPSGDTPPLGHIVTWNLASGTVVEHDALLGALERYDLLAWAPEPIRPKTAMRRALREMDKDHLVRLIEDKQDYTIYALIDEQVRGEEGMLPDLDYTTQLRMVWWKTEGNDPEDALAFDDETQGERFRPVVAKYMASHTSGDISQVILKLVRAAAGVSLRANGGVYFVPRGERAGSLAAARELLDDMASAHLLGAESYLSTFTVADEEAHRNDMRLHVAQDIKADIKRLDDDIREKEQTAREALAKQRSGKETRATGVSDETIKKYLTVAQGIKDKASLYVDLLRFNADDVDARLNKLCQRLDQLAFSPEAPF